MTKLTLLIEEQIRQVAQKKGQTIWEALNLSYEATLKQIAKFKMKKRAKRKQIIWLWQEPFGPPP